MLALQSEHRLQAEDQWSVLSGSRVTHADPAMSRYYTLIAAIDTGWRVESPIYLRADWSTAAQDSKVYHFVLQRDTKRMTTLLSVPDCEAVRRLIADNGWWVSPSD